MNRYYYDFHLHSCLSPCGSEDNTPNNLAGMAKLCGLQMIALTDHNTTKNCPAFFEACRRYGLIPVAGAELTTAEDIHAVCLFETLEGAAAFDAALQAHRTLIPNRTDIFGEQRILDGEDRVIGEEPYLLSNATDLSLEDAPAFVAAFGGICYPAHIDRPANGVLSVLGTFPATPRFTCVELSNAEKKAELVEKHHLQDMTVLIGSDAHYLTELREKEHYFTLEDAPYSEALVRRRLFEKLRQI